MQAFEELEEKWGKWAGLREGNVVACASGTCALHLALEALQLPPGSEVITNNFSMIAVPRAISMAGLTPVFVDCTDDLLLDLDLVDKAIDSREGKVRAILPVHIYGRRTDMGEVAAIAAKYGGINIIEDGAETHGIPPHPSTDAICHSFYVNKLVAAKDGEGGAIGFRERELADRTRKLRCLGFTQAHDFHHIPRGHNYRMSNLHASAVLDSLAKAEANLYVRRWAEEIYNHHCPQEWRMPPTDSPWVYSIRIPLFSSGKMERAVNRLNEVGIQARQGFKPMTWQVEYQQNIAFGNGNAERAAREVFYLPLTPGSINEDRIKQAFEIIHRVVKS